MAAPCGFSIWTEKLYDGQSPGSLDHRLNAIGFLTDSFGRCSSSAFHFPDDQIKDHPLFRCEPVRFRGKVSPVDP
jgi:hypothetical protein